MDRTTASNARWLALSLTLSLAIVVFGMAWTWRVGQTAGRYYHELSHAQDELTGLRHIASVQGKLSTK